jgi:SAM-dependent methyltransferase
MNINMLYKKIYESVCGSHPNVLPWHFQWSATRQLHQKFKRVLAHQNGRILDVGCGEKPYKDWFGSTSEYVGLDIYHGPHVDVVVSASAVWPLPTDHFDVVFSSQVLEHVENLDLTLLEMQRVVKGEGELILAFPFLYNEHGSPWDFRRFTVNSAERLFPEFDVIRLEKVGAIGSTLSLLFLNWLSSFKLLKAVLPIWILISLCVNLIGVALDKLDRTGFFYHNILLVVKAKKNLRKC